MATGQTLLFFFISYYFFSFFFPFFFLNEPLSLLSRPDVGTGSVRLYFTGWAAGGVKWWRGIWRWSCVFFSSFLLLEEVGRVGRAGRAGRVGKVGRAGSVGRVGRLAG